MDTRLKKMLCYEYLVIIFLVIVFFVVDFGPKFKEMGGLNQKINFAKLSMKMLSESEKKKVAGDLKEELSRLKEGFSLIQASTQEFEKRIIQEKNIPLITLGIEDLATSSKIELSAIKPLDPQVKKGFEVLPIELGFQAEYQYFLDFLTRVENSSTRMVVQSLSVSKDNYIYPVLDVRVTLYVLFSAQGQRKSEAQEPKPKI